MSIARGLTAAGSSIPVLVSILLAVLVFWIGATALGVGSPAGPMAEYLSLPPVSPILVDLSFLFSVRASAPVEIGAGVVLVLFRAVLVSFWIGSLRAGLSGRVGSGAQVSAGLRALRARFAAVLAIEAAFFALSLFIYTFGQLLGPQLGGFAIVGTLLFGLYFLIFAPIAAVIDGLSPRDAARLAVRTARIPGPTHALLVAAYLLFAIIFPLASPGGRLPAATPALGAWIYVMFINFLHVGVLGAFTYRWLFVRREVLQEAGFPVAAETETEMQAGAGLEPESPAAREPVRGEG